MAAEARATAEAAMVKVAVALVAETAVESGVVVMAAVAGADAWVAAVRAMVATVEVAMAMVMVAALGSVVRAMAGAAAAAMEVDQTEDALVAVQAVAVTVAEVPVVMAVGMTAAARAAEKEEAVMATAGLEVGELAAEQAMEEGAVAMEVAQTVEAMEATAVRMGAEECSCEHCCGC